MTNDPSPKIATKSASMFMNLLTASLMLVGILAASSHVIAGADDAKPNGDQGPASTAYAQANAKMHTRLAITYTGDADADFVPWMIPHHQGAIDAAKVELQYGKDPDMLKMAKMILGQETEIAAMKAWLKQHGM